MSMWESTSLVHPFGCEPDCNGTMMAGAFDLNTWGWMVQNYSSLWYTASVRGGNRGLPRRIGSVGYPRRLDESTFSLVFYVTGLFDAAGDPYTDPMEGFEENLELIWQGLCNPVDSGDGAVACVLTTPSGVNRTARVQFDPLRRSSDPEDVSLVEFQLTGTIISGRFERDLISS